MKNSEYWKLRFAQLEAAQNRKGAEVYAEIERQYRQAQKEIEGKIDAWYRRFADNNGVSMAEARRMLSARELAELKWDVNDYIRHGKENAVDQKWMKELENASARFHISRLEALKLQTQQSLEIMFGNQLDGVDTAMKHIFLDGYYHTAYEIQKGFGIGWDIAGLDQRQIEKIIMKPWAVDGKNFSERIWGNKEKLISEVHSELTRNILLGQDPQKAIDAIAKKMNTSKVNAGRLVMTEEAYFSSAAQGDCFNDLGVEKYEIVATLDSHTSEICQGFDGQVFPMKDFEPGLTAPPFHVNCRSTTVPYFEDNFGQPGERAARGEDGKTYYVPADMTYQEWKEAFVEEAQTASAQGKIAADYLVRSHVPGQDITDERRIVEDVIASMPQKVRDALEQGSIIDIGKEGACQYDYTHDILYIAKGADKTSVIHEIGHVVENKLLNSEQVTIIRKKLIGNVDVFEIVPEIYEDMSKNEVEVFLLKKAAFISDYQGRIYVDSDNIFDAFDADGKFKDDLLWEFVSEGFRSYIEEPEILRGKIPELFSLIEEAVQ